jgi:2,4-dienoyl-CoA reductase-like NADH-dependent reductase (Old Yellow Enzyme family)
MASFKTASALRAHLASSRIDLPFDDELVPASLSPLAQPLVADGLTVGNRFCALPMEGWDGTREGAPSDLTRRRWRNFGRSGAKLIWGGEAVSVRPDGRDSPAQLMLTPATLSDIAALRGELVGAHRDQFGPNADRDLIVGLQLTHSGRYSRPEANDVPAPLAACAHPLLDRRFSTPPRIVTDAQLDELVGQFVAAARMARSAGFDFVDIKQCHGYLGHELLGARTRQGRYGGSAENRFRFVRAVIEGIRADVPDLKIGVRLSAVDTPPFRAAVDRVGVAEPSDPAAPAQGFGLLQDDDLETALEDSRELLAELERLGVRWICISAGTPYYNPHVLRPAFSPPVDGYLAPEDPLRGVARHVRITARLKAAFPNLVFVGSGYSYLQEWLPHVAQHAIGRRLCDVVGLGRTMLSYPTLPADVLDGRALGRHSLCRTFSDCTSGPRLGLVSGCYPLDPFYRTRPDAERVRRGRLVTGDS